MEKLKIAQLVLPWIPLPPPKYAGTEWIVYWLTEELVKRGHQVSLFTVGESKTKAKKEFLFQKALGLQKDVMKTLKSSFYPLMHVSYCFQKEFDIIHSHAQFLALPFSAVSKTPTLHTFHRQFKFETKDDLDLVKHYGYLNFSSISNSQRIKGINFIKTVYNGIPIEKFRYCKKPENYLLWVGRIVDKKGPKEAILTAKKLNLALIIAGKITDEKFFNRSLKPLIRGKIKYVGEVSQEKLVPLYRKAKCFLCPVKWNEPFGLTAVEAMACGTPVVAFKNGALKETVLNNKTGFLIPEKKGIKGLTEAIQKIEKIKRIDCRARVEKYFTVQKMTSEYEKLYYKIVRASKN